MDTRLKADDQYLTCWLRSVNLAMEQQCNILQTLQNRARTFFHPRTDTEDLSDEQLVESAALFFSSYTDYTTLNESVKQKISIDELFEANSKLREDAENQKKIIKSLNYVVRVLKLKPFDNDDEIMQMVVLTSFIEEQSKEILRVNKQREDLLKNLENKNEELNNYAHIVSHDLKSPLRSIDSLINWVLEDDNNAINKDSKDYLDLILKNVEKMDALISGILNYSTIDKAELDRYEVDTHYLVTELSEILFVPKNVTLTIKNNLPVIIGDKFRLQQLFQNLIQNAIQSIEKEAGFVEIGVVEKKAEWQFYVKDNGEGISEQYFNKIFKIFEKIDNNQNAFLALKIVEIIVRNFIT